MLLCPLCELSLACACVVLVLDGLVLASVYLSFRFPALVILCHVSDAVMCSAFGTKTFKPTRNKNIDQAVHHEHRKG